MNIPWGADLSYIPFSQASPVKREPVALKVQRHAGTTYVLPEQKSFPLCYCESPLLAPLWGVRVIGTRRYTNWGISNNLIYAKKLQMPKQMALNHGLKELLMFDIHLNGKKEVACVVY